jgi:putative endonuclease
MNSSRHAISPSRESPRVLLGQRGEQFAAAYLEQLGYLLVAANFSLPVGRNLKGATINAEIDLIAYDGPTLCFIEVKTRSSDWYAPPQVNVDLRKRRQVTRAAQAYRHMFGLEEQTYRYDVVTVVLSGQSGELSEIEVLRNFWTEKQVGKRRTVERYYD